MSLVPVKNSLSERVTLSGERLNVGGCLRRVRAWRSPKKMSCDAIVRRVTGEIRLSRFASSVRGHWGMRGRTSDIDIAIDGPRRVDPAHMADIRDACDRL